MAKSKTRFSTPTLWKPIGQSCMQQAVDGSYVRLSEYRELELAYRCALVQLDRAAKRVNNTRAKD